MMRSALTSPPITIEALEGRTFLAADMVIQWNQIMQSMCRSVRPGIGPTVAARDEAVMDIAGYDAVNGIDGSYEQFMIRRSAPEGASPDAAAAQAAFATLWEMFPDQRPTLVKDLAASYRSLGAGPAVIKGRNGASLLRSASLNCVKTMARTATCSTCLEPPRASGSPIR
jgi:hypothetical protein